MNVHEEAAVDESTARRCVSRVNIKEKREIDLRMRSGKPTAIMNKNKAVRADTLIIYDTKNP